MLKPAPDLEPQTLETLWIGDDAVDAEASTGVLTQWCETGEAECLVLRPGVAPSPISYRPLTTREVAQLPQLDGTGGAIVSHCYEACRYGLVNIKGVRLRRGKHHGVRGLLDASLDMLTQYSAELPIMHLHNHWLRLMGFELEPLEGESGDALLATDLAQWLGGLVLAATFRSRRGAA